MRGVGVGSAPAVDVEKLAGASETSPRCIGPTVQVIGDINRDGSDDILCDIWSRNPDLAAVIVLDGRTGMCLRRIGIDDIRKSSDCDADNNSCYAGTCSGIGDVDGDGRSEIAIGCDRVNDIDYRALAIVSL